MHWAVVTSRSYLQHRVKRTWFAWFSCAGYLGLNSVPTVQNDEMIISRVVVHKMQNEESIELPQTYSSSLSTSEFSAPVDTSLLYTPWSTYGDDPKQPTVSQVNVKSRYTQTENMCGDGCLI